MRSALLAIVAVIAALAVYLIAREDDSRVRSGRDDGSRPEPEASSPTRPGAEPSTKKPAPVQHWLRARVEVSDGRAVPVQLTLQGEGSHEPIRKTVTPGTEVELDVTPRGARAKLVVEADHPDYLPFIARGSPGETVVLRLLRAAIVHGRVIGGDGTPAAGANVAIFAFRDGKPEDEPLAFGGTDDEGRYRIRVASEGSILVAAHEDGFVPAATTVQAFVGREVEAAPMALAHGASIAGRVTVNGNAPAKQARVDAEPQVNRHPFWYGNLIWADGAAQSGEATGFCEDDGSYRIQGLVPGMHRLSLIAGGTGGAELSSQVPVRDINAPASGVDFELAASELLLRFAVEKKLRYRLRIVGKETTTISTTRRAPLRMAVVPGTTYSVRLEVPGFEPSAIEVRALAVGETRTVDLKPGKKLPRASLLLTVRSDSGPPPTRVGVTLLGDDESSTLKRSGPASMELHDLPVAKYSLLVVPEPWWLPDPGLWQLTRTDVELREGAPARVVLEVKRGGTARITARGPAGGLLQPGCRVEDASGKQLFVAFARDNLSSVGSEILQEDGPSDIVPALPEGRYTLHFQLRGYAELTREVEIRVGERTPVEVTLTPR